MTKRKNGMESLKKISENIKTNDNENIDEIINHMGAVLDEIRSTYIDKRKEYLTNPYWGFDELIILFESKIIKMKQSITIDKRKAELIDVATYAIMAIALEKYYNNKNEYPMIYK